MAINIAQEMASCMRMGLGVVVVIVVVVVVESYCHTLMMANSHSVLMAGMAT